METVMAVRNDLAARRSDQYFTDIFQEALNAIGKLNLEPLQLPRCSRPPKRLAGQAPSYQAATVEEHFRKSFFVVLDTAIQQLDDRWQILDGTGLHVYKQLEEVLLTGTVADVVQNYADINHVSLPAQLQMFIRHCQPRTIHSVRNAFQQMSPDMRSLFEDVELLARLLMVCPATSCEAERSFSAMRRLKTWLRNSMSQVRLNAAAVCHVHKDRLDSVSDMAVAAEFAGRTATRLAAFGRYGQE